MSEEDNGTQPEPVTLATTPPPQQTNLNMQLTPQGVVLSFPVNLGIDNATMGQVVKAYLQAHPDLLEEIAREVVAQKRQEMNIIQLVKRSKNE